jgi:serine/threonine protein kinase
MAPEIVLRRPYVGIKADIWALGVLFYAMICGAFPFKGGKSNEL